MQPMPLEKEKLSDLVAERLVQYIEENNLQPGDMLPTEKELAKCFRIGRTSVREGISKLKSIGLLHTVQGYGCIINETSISSFLESISTSVLSRFVKLDMQDYRQIMETRALLETYALRTYISSDRITDPQKLYIIVRRMDKALGISDYSLFQELDFDFHRQIVHLANNSILSQIYELVKEPFIRRAEAFCPTQDHSRLQEEHRQLLDGIRRKDMAVVQILDNHIKCQA
ncbi:FadR/GntR family transcriptional regulator [Sediminispirochaeta smaragdinae]|uniref:GntR domain protein n=1 Tax=Sediminispirochaeta smaragdinae (strain DSM 11293 / JCM 15392 / SEBR 4228) TaxID=573413 RepID=E1RB41_SEDSS|nr:FCD domain-containing protein [Sediminispirochaeta smaragdinae]ADK79571.1 GntR domain protein [Sediminispirochaeta smaragdinae DSM 11293]